MLGSLAVLSNKVLLLPHQARTYLKTENHKDSPLCTVVYCVNLWRGRGGRGELDNQLALFPKIWARISSMKRAGLHEEAEEDSSFRKRPTGGMNTWEVVCCFVLSIPMRLGGRGGGFDPGPFSTCCISPYK